MYVNRVPVAVSSSVPAGWPSRRTSARRPFRDSLDGLRSAVSGVAIAPPGVRTGRGFDADPLAEHGQHEVHFVESKRSFAAFELDHEPFSHAGQFSQLLLGQARAEPSLADEGAHRLFPIGTFLAFHTADSRLIAVDVKQ